MTKSFLWRVQKITTLKYGREYNGKDLNANIEKSKVMYSTDKENIKVSFQLNGKEVEQVESSNIKEWQKQIGRKWAEANYRLESAVKLYYSLSNSFLKKETKNYSILNLF